MTDTAAGAVERLGEVTCPSGILLLLDGGLAWMWSHDRPPVLPEWAQGHEIADGAIDFMLVGPDGVAAGEALGLQQNPSFLYDMPPDAQIDILRAFGRLKREHGFDARLEALPERVPHRRRVDAMLERGPAGVVQYQGMWAVAVAGTPTDQPLPVFGERMADEEFSDRWKRVWIELRQGEAASSDPVGEVLVDMARVTAVDVDAIGAWDEETVQDGMADYVFWGLEADEVARRTGAPQLEPEMWGWTDLPLDACIEHARPVEALLEAGELRFATDFRPHTHAWAVMRQVRGAETESGVLDLGGARMCLFMTTWGDGAWPVFVERAADGRALRVVIEFA